jgi:hypothetical protein
MTIDKNKLGNKRVALNTLAEAIDTNIEAAATVTVADTANLYAGENVEACLAELAGAGRTTETVKANATNIDALERSGSTIAVDGAVADSSRNVTLTMKDGNGDAVEGYHVVGVKVTNGDGSGGDAGTPAVINTDLDTTDGLVVGAAGEQISPSNGAAIANAGNASLLAFTKADGTLTVQLNKDSGNDFFLVHFLLPDGSVVSSTEIELNNAG